MTRSGDVEDAGERTGERTAGGDSATPALERGPLPGELTSPDARVEESNPSLPRKLLSDTGQHTAPTEPTSIRTRRAPAREEPEEAPFGEDSGRASSAGPGRPRKDDPDLENPEFLFDENEPVEPATPAAARPAAAVAMDRREFIDFGETEEDAPPAPEPIRPPAAPLAQVRAEAEPEPEPDVDSQSDALAASLRSARRQITARDRAAERQAKSAPAVDDIAGWGTDDEPPRTAAAAPEPDRARAEPSAPAEPAESAARRRGTEVLGRRRGSKKKGEAADEGSYGALSGEQRGTGAASSSASAATEAASGRVLERVSRVAMLAFALALAVSAGRALIGNDARATSGPTQVKEGNWDIHGVEVLRLRDSGGQRVMVVRGRLGPADATALPGVQAILLDGKGESIGTPIRARLPWLELSALAPERLAAYLNENGGSGPAQGGFTLLIPTPPDAVRRFRLEIDARY